MEIELRHQVTRKVTLVGALVNTLLSSLQIIFGLVGQSQALLADGIHTLSDLSSDFIVLFATAASARTADDGHPYGHGRIETLASLLLGIILIGVGISLVIRGSFSFTDIDRPDPDGITVFFACLAIVSKEFLYRYTIKAARKFHSTLLESNALHHRSDSLSSIVVVIGISSQLAGIAHMDTVAAIIVGLMIISIGFRLARTSLSELIDSSLSQELVGSIELTIKSSNAVKAIHSLRTRSMGGLGFVDAEIRVDPCLTVSEAHHVAYSLERQIKTDFNSVIDVSIHVDPMTETGHDDLTQLPSRETLLAGLNASWQELAISKQILQINLHYLGQGIELDLILPISCIDQKYENELEELTAKVDEMADICNTNLYFKR